MAHPCQSTAVVGAWGDDDNGGASGSAYIFERNQGGANAWEQVAKITATDGAEGDEFGTSVAVSSNTVVVGAWGDTYNGDYSGSVYIYTLSHLETSKTYLPVMLK